MLLGCCIRLQPFHGTEGADGFLPLQRLFLKEMAMATTCIAKDHTFENEVKPQLEHMQLDLETSKLIANTKLALQCTIFLTNFPYTTFGPNQQKSTK